MLRRTPVMVALVLGASLMQANSASADATPTAAPHCAHLSRIMTPGAEHQEAACLADLTTAGTTATGHTNPDDWSGLHAAGTTNNPARARALGYAVDRYKIMAFVISAGLAGLAGGLNAISHGFASLEDVYWTTSGKVVLMTVIGGIGTLWGSVLGAAVIEQLEDFLASSGFDGIGIVTGTVFVLAVLLFRRGIWGTVAYWLVRWRGDAGQPPRPEPGVGAAGTPAATEAIGS